MLRISLRGLKIFEVSKKADARLFLKARFSFLIHILNWKDCQVDPMGFAPLFPSGDKGFRGSKEGVSIFESSIFVSHTHIKLERLSSGPHRIRSVLPFGG